ncbi:MBOAT family O-acyltransferase [Dongia rigui]|uniref:Probable alginate O-acetylase AlgI n=1 Tax=Dongia rigui TaxID=940149 RepID=A0ABU5E4A0_9PROT|nr:MBOAT family O-acyltransferase [Dongia rigui]MDY0873646.1 MBOAT family O-acyltransferase [Dongia rigui]
MLFNSLEFIAIFLPVSLLVFHLTGRYAGQAAAISTLSIASVLFYAYWSPIYILLIVAEITFSFCIGRYLSDAAVSSATKRKVLIFSIALLLVTLGYFKYTNLLLSGINSLMGIHFPILVIILPLGISFHTFQQIAYLVDASKGRAPIYHFNQFALFVVFFPQLIAGPIVHHHELIPQFSRPAWTRLNPQNVLVGFSYFALGLFKKTMIADCLAQIASPVFDNAAGGAAIPALRVWVAMLAYTLQIYFDFSAYSDMAVGLARMFNLRLPINFFSPYKAKNISQFWRRWHISLSRFLRDYLYVPLGGSRKGASRAAANLMITMLLGGLWHGAGLQFVIWGGLHGLFLAVHRTVSPAIPAALKNNKIYGIGATMLTFFCVSFAWVFFRADDLQTALSMFAAMIPTDEASRSLSTKFIKHAPFDGWPVLLGALLLALFAPNLPQIFRRQSPALLTGVLDKAVFAQIRRAPARFLVWRPGLVGGLIIGICFAIGFLAIFAWQSEFLYFQF